MHACDHPTRLATEMEEEYDQWEDFSMDVEEDVSIDKKITG